MIDIIHINSSGKLLFIIFTMIPILFYLMWRSGFNFGKVKILMILSNIVAFYFYFSSSEHLFFFALSLSNIIGTLLFLNLLFFSSIFTIIVLTIRSNQNLGETSQVIIKKEKIHDFTPLPDWDNKRDLELSTRMELESYNEKNSVEDNLENYREVSKIEYSNDEFQKFINNLFKNQKTHQKDQKI
ncbi:MAG: hypothetical protein ACFFCE_00280 [Promethearchaeota archaeon]